MLKILLLTKFIILNLSSVIIAQGYWSNVKTHVDVALRNIHFTDSLNGWVCGDSGILLKTNDGGENWSLLQTTTNNTFWGMHFLNENEGWLVSWLDDSTYNGTIVHKTTNGGKDWEDIEFTQPITYAIDIFFVDSLKGFAGINYSPLNSKIYYTTDGGYNWIAADIFPNTSNYPFLPVRRFYSSGDYLFACGGAIDIAGVIWKSSDSGFTWYADSTVAPDPINELYFFDSLNIIGIGGDRELFYGIGVIRSTDRGNFWDYYELDILGVANSMDFRTPAEGWASLGSTQTFIYTIDSAKTWTEIPAPGNAEINDIFFVDSTMGFAVGNNGVILKYEIPDTVLNVNNLSLPKDFILHQNYPNPFNPETIISFKTARQSFISLKIFDILGNEIKTLVNEVKSAGNYKIKFHAEDLASGIYYYQLKAEDYLLTKKMILLR